MFENFGLPAEQDKDQWDQDAWHIVAVHQDTVVGYYRAIEHSCMGFYTETEFDISGLNIAPSQILEIGRAAADQRHPTAIFALWRAIIQLAQRHGKQWIMGSASIKPDEFDVRQISAQWQKKYNYLENQHARPLNPYQESHCGHLVQPPKLIQVYEKLGARIVSDLSWDPTFRTADVVTMLDITCIDEKWRKKLGITGDIDC
jgi:putative hemolysin